ncbi:dermonecrotic toxin domain-containing protein [Pseudomonas tremae]
MNPIWSPLRQDTLFHPSAFLLEQPSVLRPEHSSDRHDTLNASPKFTLPTAYSPLAQTPLPPVSEERGPEDIASHIERQLKAMRDSPGFRLIADSALLLKACQLDMDFPPPRQHYVREQLITLLMHKSGNVLDPDTLQITFSSDDLPAVDDQGQEHYSVSLSLTDVALTSFEPEHFLALYRSVITDTPISEDTPLLMTRQVFKWIGDMPLDHDYSAILEAFRVRHEATWRTLARLAFLDNLARQHTHRHISRDGYRLALDALGMSRFPLDGHVLDDSGRGELTEVRLLSLNGEQVPGIFQVRSKTTSHCFIHILGAKGKIAEYISDDPAHMPQRLLAAMNASGLYGHALLAMQQHAAVIADAPLIEGDLFTALTQASFTAILNGRNTCATIDLLRPVARSLALAGAADLWQTQPDILEQIPVASKMAAHIMANYLKDHHGLTLNPEHVFIAYKPGHSNRPLGVPRVAPIHVHTPDEKPVSLTEALTDHYRVDHPAGYVDHGGGTEVFFDPSGLGNREQGQILKISPQALENYISGFGFLNWMTQRIHDFWDQQHSTIERAFRSSFIAQLLISLKRGKLRRSSFDLVVETLAPDAQHQWRALGFFVQGSLIDGLVHQYTGLLVLELPGARKVLYQAGHAEGFLEFVDDTALALHLTRKTADPEWRETVMRYVPLSHQQRLNYLFKLWGGAQAPNPPASILRPWTDALYNPDTRQAMRHSLCEKRLSNTPFAFLHQRLRQNALDDAEEQITTPAQVSLADWTERLLHLQRLLVPMSLLLTPAFIASLATEVGLASLAIAATQLPGRRHAEKNHALLATLSLGLLQRAPQTPRMLRSLSRIAKPAASKSQAALTAIDRALRRHVVNPRQTRLEKFFHTDALLRRWTVTTSLSPTLLPIHAWKLGRRFLLWTSDRGQARTLVVSTHGYYTPWSRTVGIPNGTEIRTYAPHGYELVDPQLHRVVNKNARPFSHSNTAVHSVMPHTSLEPLFITDKLIAGTSLPGRLKNYSLSKFQSATDETYDEIARVVGNSRASPLQGWLPPTPMDVLTVRNRFGMTPPSLADLFNSLSAQGIHYDRILLVHCRCAAFSALLSRAPVYHAPTAGSVIANMA